MKTIMVECTHLFHVELLFGDIELKYVHSDCTEKMGQTFVVQTSDVFCNFKKLNWYFTQF
jgi:hypothetical protein